MSKLLFMSIDEVREYIDVTDDAARKGVRDALPVLMTSVGPLNRLYLNPHEMAKLFPEKREPLRELVTERVYPYKWRPCSSLPIVNDPILQGVSP